MYKLIQHLIAFKYACKINHWSTGRYSQHLLYDRLTTDIDTWVDSISEIHFMATDKTNVFAANILEPKYINCNLVQLCETIISLLEDLQTNSDQNAGLNSLLGSIEEGFLNKLALAKLTM